VNYVQISTIDVRTEGVDRPSGGKKSGKDEASAESAFAAFFATQLDAQRQPEAKPAANAEADSVSEVDSTDDAKALSNDQTRAKHQAESGSAANAEETAAQEAEAPIPQHAEGGQGEAAAITVLQPRHAGSSARFSVVAKDGSAATVKLHVSTAQSLVTGNAKTNTVEVPLVPSTPSVLPVPEAEVTETVPATLTPLAPAIETGIVRVEVDPESKVAPQPAPKPDAASAAEESAKADAIELPADAPEIATNNSGGQKEQGSGDNSAKSPVSKLQSHAATPGATPVQTVENPVSAEPKISDPQAADSAKNVQVTPQDDLADDAFET
jgi:hypothetical protein